MAFTIPTTKTQADTNLAGYEAKLGQNTPINNKAFLRVLSILQAASQTQLFKYAADRALQTLALTATGENLDIIGNNFGVTRKPAEAASSQISLPAVNGTVIPVTVDFVGDSNGIRYSVDAAATASGGAASISVTARVLGALGNLSISDTLIIGTPVVGAESVATVTAVNNTGANRETDDAYRQRVLDAERLTTGGANAADYRVWSEEVGGVARAYPFAGLPIGNPGYPGAPPERTVYIESTTAIDPDGIPPASLIDDVRDNITTDPATGLARQPLGLTDATLYVEPIIRTPFYVTVSGLNVDASIEAQVKSDITTALTAYFLTVRPYVEGVDPPSEKNNVITDPAISEVVHDVVSAAGGSVGGVAFGIAAGTSLPTYTLAQNETAKLQPGGVTYV
jgi:uncharacterized phage protein gp47/JayE